MGPYCRYCDRRCFLLRVLNNGETMLLATCRLGMQHDLTSCGETHETACNPVTQPRRAALLGILRELRSCHRHGIAECDASDCRRTRRSMREGAEEPGEDEPDPLAVAAAQFPRLTWLRHGRPRAAVFFGYGGKDPIEFLSVRHLVGRPCVIRAEEVPKRENGMNVGSRVVLRFADGTELRSGAMRRLVLAPVAAEQAA